VVTVVMTPFVDFWGRQWNLLDILTAATFLTLHGLCLFAPFHFTWAAFWVAVALYILTGLGVTMGFHRNLAHKSFRIPKWLEYLLAYFGVLALQVCIYILRSHTHTHTHIYIYIYIYTHARGFGF
jgi:stearoyl-CoA desaturase (delta-9 desaturase)